MKSQNRSVLGTRPYGCCKRLCLIFWFVAALCTTTHSFAVAQGFTVTAGISSLTIHPGDANVSIPVSVSSSTVYSGPVTVTLTGLPSGMTVTPIVTSPGGSGTVGLSASIAADQEAFPATGPQNPDSASTTINVLAFAGSMTATTPLALTVSLENPAFVPRTLNLPVVRINTGGVSIDSKTVSVPGTITITSPDGSVSYLPSTSDTDNTATFHVHGSSTALMPKLPYHVSLNTSLDLLTQMGLICPYVTGSGTATCDKSKSYILLANYDDKSMLRDWAASALANAIPFGGSYLSPTPLPSSYSGKIPTPSGTKTILPWAPHSLFVELYLNGAYEGTYQLIEEVKVDSHRVNITELTNSQVSGDLSGGYLLEIDQHQDEDYVFFTPSGIPIGLIDPDFTPEIPEQTSYITTYVDNAENALLSSSFQDPSTGWRAYFDQASAVNFYIVNDLMGNVDGGEFYSSDYLYKAADNPFLYMGPIWDFDISSGNVNYQPIVDPTVPWTTTQSPWYVQWFKDPGFKSAAQQQWNALKNNGVLASWLASIASEASTLTQTQANNFGRWPMLGIRVWPNSEAVGSYTGEVSYLVDWLTLRMGYMDGFLNGTAATTTTLSTPSGTLRAGNPVTITANVSGNTPTGSITFSYSGIVVGQSPISSTGTATLTTSNIPAGTYYLEAYYNGDSKNAISGALSPQVTILPTLAEVNVNLSTSLASLSYGSPITLTSAVAATTGSAVPTGTVTFSANGVSLGASAVSATGVATLNTSSLPGGSDVIQAAYSGDTNNAAATSNSVSTLVITDFTLSVVGSLSQELGSNAAGSFNFTLNPIGGVYPGNVSLTVTGVPSGVSYSLSETAVATAAGPQQFTLMLNTSSTVASGKAFKTGGFFFCGLFLLSFSATARRFSSRTLFTLFFAGCSLGLLGLSGCSASQPLQPYSITVTGTAGNVQHSAIVTLYL